MNQIHSNISYQIQIESLTPYGSQVFSNELIYSHGNNKVKKIIFKTEQTHFIPV